MNVVELEKVSVRFDETIAVDSASMDVRDREIVALVGPSGCGKTTLLRTVAGFERPDEGSVRIGERIVAGTEWVEPEKRSIGMVFQQGALFPHLTVEENVGYGVERSRRRARVAEMLDLVDMGSLGSRYPDELSGGQRQRVALARALAPSPAIILFDEPFASLDEQLRSRLRTEVRSILEQAGAAAIFVTHDREEAVLVGDRLAVMSHGRIVQQGSPEEIYASPRSRAVAEITGRGLWIPGEELNELFGAGFDPKREYWLRPDDLQFVDTEKGSHGIVGDVHHLGSTVDHQVRLGDRRTFTVRAFRHEAKPTGSSVYVALRSHPLSFENDQSGGS